MRKTFTKYFSFFRPLQNCLDDRIPRVTKTDPRSSSNTTLQEDFSFWWYYFWVHKKVGSQQKVSFQLVYEKVQNTSETDHHKELADNCRCGCRWTGDSPWKQLRQRKRFLQPAILTAPFRGTSHASTGHGKHPNMPSQRALPCQQALYITVTTRVFSCTVSENKHRPVLMTSCLLSYQASGWFGCLQACILYECTIQGNSNLESFCEAHLSLIHIYAKPWGDIIQEDLQAGSIHLKQRDSPRSPFLFSPFHQVSPHAHPSSLPHHWPGKPTPSQRESVISASRDTVPCCHLGAAGPPLMHQCWVLAPSWNQRAL